MLRKSSAAQVEPQWIPSSEAEAKAAISEAMDAIRRGEEGTPEQRMRARAAFPFLKKLWREERAKAKAKRKKRKFKAISVRYENGQKIVTHRFRSKEHPVDRIRKMFARETPRVLKTHGR